MENKTMNDLNFTTEVDLDADGANYEYRGKVTVKWSLGLDARERGVKDIYITIPDQTICVVKVHHGEEEDLYEDQELEVKECQYEVMSERDSFFNGIIPHTLSLYNGKWMLEF